MFKIYKKDDSKLDRDDLVIFFDTNVLINIIRENNTGWIEFLKSIKVKNVKFLITEQVGLEFESNIAQIFKEKIASLKMILSALESFPVKFKFVGMDEKFLDKIQEIMTGDLKLEYDNFVEQNNIFLNELKKKFKPLISSIRNDLFEYEKMINGLTEYPQIVYDLTNLIDILDDYKPETNFYDKNQELIFFERYDKKIPPGFEDAKKDNNKYGDVISWFQMIDIVKAKEFKNVIFLTQEKKKDWFITYTNNERSPRKELLSEFYTKTKCEYYYQYSFDEVLQIFKTNTIKRISMDESEIFHNLQSLTTYFDESKIEEFLAVKIRWADLKNKHDDGYFSKKKEIEDMIGNINTHYNSEIVKVYQKTLDKIRNLTKPLDYTKLYGSVIDPLTLSGLNLANPHSDFVSQMSALKASFEAVARPPDYARDLLARSSLLESMNRNSDFLSQTSALKASLDAVARPPDYARDLLARSFLLESMNRNMIGVGTNPLLEVTDDKKIEEKNDSDKDTSEEE